MEDKSHAIIAVTFLIVFILGAVTIYMWLHRGPSEDRYYDIVSSYAVSGLQPEAPVEFKGLQVGNVKSIHFDPHDPEKVIIRIAVFKNAYITHSTYAQLGNKGITGLTYIILSIPPGQSSSSLATNAQHPAQIPMHQGLLQSLEDSTKTALHRINHIAGSVDLLLNQNNRRYITETLKHLDEASGELVGLEKQLAPAVKAMPGIAAQTHALLETGERLGKSLNRLAQNANQPVKGLGKTASSIRKLGQSSDEMVKTVNHYLLPRIETLVQRMNRTIRQINQLARQLKSQPQSLIFGHSPRVPGPGEPGFHSPPS